MSDLVGTQIVGFLTHRLILLFLSDTFCAWDELVAQRVSRLLFSLGFYIFLVFYCLLIHFVYRSQSLSMSLYGSFDKKKVFALHFCTDYLQTCPCI